MPEKVIDPNKIVTDPVLLSALVRQGIDKDYVEFTQDYAPRSLGKRHSPYAKFYRDLKSNKGFMVVSGLPMVNADGVKVEVGWEKKDSTYVSKVNQFQAQVSGKAVTIICINDQPTGKRKGDYLTYTPQLYLDGKEASCGKETLLAVDPTNENYQNNVLEWDYGICKRRLRLIEGRILGTWVFEQNPKGEVRIHYDQQGDFKLRLGQYGISDSEELIPASIFDNPPFGYPLTICESPETFYPDAHEETTSVDGRTYVSPATPVAWATQRAKATGDGAGDSGASDVVCQGEDPSSGGGTHSISRCPFLFDTSGLPDGATISAAVFSLYSKNQGLNNETTYPADIQVVASTPATNTAVIAADYDQFGTTKFLDTAYDLGTFIGSAAYHDFTLNAAGRAAISKTSITKLGTRPNNDFSDATDPSLRSYAIGYYAEQGEGYKPKLVVTYTAGEHYERSGTALLGLLGSGSRGFALARTDTALLGLLPTATRAASYLRTKTALLGLKATASRSIAISRVKTALLGLKAISLLCRKCEYYKTGDDAVLYIHDDLWQAQTFTPSESHKIISVKLKIYRTLSPGTITVSIKATDGNGHPTGEDLCSGTTNGNTLTTDTDGEWREIIIGDGYSLSGSTKYAIVVRALDGNGTNHVGWRMDDSSPTYSGGNAEYSIDGGENWSSSSTRDFMFEEWGCLISGHYGRVGTALLGLLSTGSRSLVLGRSDTALLGLKSIGSRALALSRLDIALLGLKGIASRFRSYTRTNTALLGLKTTATRAVALTRSKTALLGLKIVGSRAIAITRSKIALLGLLGTGSRALHLSRSKTALLGLLTTANKSISLARVDTAMLGLKTTANRTISITRAKVALLGLKATGIMSTVKHYIRTGIAYLGLTVTGSRAISLSRSALAYLGLKVTGIYYTAEHYYRTGIAYLGLVAMGTRSLALARANTALLGLKTTSSRVLAFTRADTALLGLKGIGSRTIAITRSAVALLGLTVTGIIVQAKTFLIRLFTRNYFDVSMEAKPYFEVSMEAKPYYDVSVKTKTGGEE